MKFEITPDPEVGHEIATKNLSMPLMEEGLRKQLIKLIDFLKDTCHWALFQARITVIKLVMDSIKLSSIGSEFRVDLS